jgi:hypothetical protein
MTRRKNKLSDQPNNNPHGPARIALAGLLDPTEREMSEMEYASLLANPETSEMIGIPLIAGGLNTSSTKIRLEQTLVFVANDNGQAYCVVYGHVGSPANDQNFELYARIPTFAAGTEVNQCMIAATSGPGVGAQSGETPPGGMNGIALVLGGGIPIYLPQSGLSLLTSEARPVAQCLTVTPVDSALVQKGTGLIVRAASIDIADDPDLFSLARLTLPSAYAEQGNERHAAALTTFDSEHNFSCVWLPQSLSNISWSETAGPSSRSITGAGYTAFLADGCAANQAFRATICTVYELKSDNYTTSTPNGMSDAGFAMVGDIQKVSPPNVLDEGLRPIQGPQAAAAVAGGKFPPVKAIEHVKIFLQKHRERFMGAFGRLKASGFFGKVAKGIGGLATLAGPLVLAAMKGRQHFALRGPKPIPALRLPAYASNPLLGFGAKRIQPVPIPDGFESTIPVKGTGLPALASSPSEKGCEGRCPKQCLRCEGLRKENL